MHRGVRRGASGLCSTRGQIDGLKARGMLAWLPILLADGIDSLAGIAWFALSQTLCFS